MYAWGEVMWTGTEGMSGIDGVFGEALYGTPFSQMHCAGSSSPRTPDHTEP